MQYFTHKKQLYENTVDKTTHAREKFVSQISFSKLTNAGNATEFAVANGFFLLVSNVRKFRYGMKICELYI